MALFSQNRWLKITVRLALFFRASGSLVSEFTSAGFTASTANDMGKYLQMYLRRGKTANGVSIISKENLERMWYDNVENPWDKVTRYGMGWNYQYEQGIKMVFHGGQVEKYLL